MWCFRKIPPLGEQDVPLRGRRKPYRQVHALPGKTLPRTSSQGVDRSSGSTPSSAAKRSRIRSLCQSGTGRSSGPKLSRISTTRAIRSSGGSSRACRRTSALVIIISRIRLSSATSTLAIGPLPASLAARNALSLFHVTSDNLLIFRYSTECFDVPCGDRPESGDSSVHRGSGSPRDMQCSGQGGPAGGGDACVAPAHPFVKRDDRPLPARQRGQVL